MDPRAERTDGAERLATRAGASKWSYASPGNGLTHTKPTDRVMITDQSVEGEAVHNDAGRKRRDQMKTIRVTCAHDCPCMCSLLAHVEDGKLVSVQGDPEHPFTAGFACGKVNRDADLVHSPERIKTPLSRTGPKGSGQFKPITWDEALDEIDRRGRRSSRRTGRSPCSATPTPRIRA